MTVSAPFVYRHTVLFEETNLVGNVYFAHYVRWQGHCRELFLHAEAPAVLAAVASGEMALVTVSCGMRYLVECYAGDTVEVRMRLAAVGSYRIGMTFDFVRGDRTLATGEQEVACMLRDPAGRLSATAPPAVLLDALARYDRLAVVGRGAR